MANEKILCAAIHFDDSVCYQHQPKNITSGIVIAGRRHHNCFATLAAIAGNYAHLNYGKEIQGFITSDNRFVDRKEALRIAENANQLITEEQHQLGLFSEDLY